MRKSVVFKTTVVGIAFAIMVASVAAIIVHVQGKGMTLQTNYNNTTIISPIKQLNASIIIDAINAKIKSVYGEAKIQ